MTQFQFVMRSGPTPGVVYPLEGDQLTIGRDASNGVAINDVEVSRKHTRLSFQGGKYVVEDLGSTNGTFVNGQRLSGPSVLKSGDVVSLGEQIVLLYEAIVVDSGATMVATPVRKSPAPVRAAPVMPAPAQNYSGQAPSGPSAAPAKKSNALVFTLVGVGLLLCCGGTFAVVDFTSSWCMFPFNIITQYIFQLAC